MTPEFERDCERLRTGEPLGYVIGWVPFLNTKIWLPSHPLIPRPETEYWVEQTIRDLQNEGHRKSFIEESAENKELRILDLCAGSGCIGIAIGKAFRDARVDFAEIDPRHHLTILKNLAENHIPLEHTKIYGGDLFEKITERYDVILSNPPYIDATLARTDESVLTHEPHLALFGGEGGMEHVARIIQESPAHLTSDGILYIEHEPEQVAAMHTLAQKAGFSAIASLPDQYGVLRTTRLARTESIMAQ